MEPSISEWNTKSQTHEDHNVIREAKLKQPQTSEFPQYYSITYSTSVSYEKSCFNYFLGEPDRLSKVQKNSLEPSQEIK